MKQNVPLSQFFRNDIIYERDLFMPQTALNFQMVFLGRVFGPVLYLEKYVNDGCLTQVARQDGRG